MQNFTDLVAFESKGASHSCFVCPCELLPKQWGSTAESTGRVCTQTILLSWSADFQSFKFCLLYRHTSVFKLLDAVWFLQNPDMRSQIKRSLWCTICDCINRSHDHLPHMLNFQSLFHAAVYNELLILKLRRYTPVFEHVCANKSKMCRFNTWQTWHPENGNR